VQQLDIKELNVIDVRCNHEVCERKRLYEHVSNSEWLPEQSCIDLQMQKHFEWQ